MKKRFKNYVGNKLLDLAEWVYAQIPEGKRRARSTAVKVLEKKLDVATKQVRALKQEKPVNGFYETSAWQDLRYRVLRYYGRVCMLCGARNCELHVDHIKPRSKFPNLELSFDNLQVLCRSCNFGKSNKDDTDWRPGA